MFTDITNISMTIRVSVKISNWQLAISKSIKNLKTYSKDLIINGKHDLPVASCQAPIASFTTITFREQ
jgi:uncharacterized Rmd1/YagE family protein